LATPNYGYEKRQRELAKKKKKEEKLKAKAEGKRHDEESPAGDLQGDATSLAAPNESSPLTPPDTP
jgi:hypothetical protein